MAEASTVGGESSQVAANRASALASRVTFAFLTALPKELAAVKSMLDGAVEYRAPGPGSTHDYWLGEIPARGGGTHAVALALGDQGNPSSAVHSTSIVGDFATLNSVIMVGIAGGAPNPAKPEDHVRLGDIVASGQGGVVKYDFVKEYGDRIEPRNPPRPPSSLLLAAAHRLMAEEEEGKRPWEPLIDRGILALSAPRPAAKTDRLADTADPQKYVKHPHDPQRRSGTPRVFHGTIGAGDILQKNPKRRDAVRGQFGVRAIEMEGAGVAEAAWHLERGFFLVRGVCDYCDENKNDVWQRYAAVVAAAYARALLEATSPVDGSRLVDEPRDHRASRLDDASRAARARAMVPLLALGLSDDEAQSLLKELVESPLPSVIPMTTSRAHLLVGDFGAGKSLVATKLHLRALEESRSNSALPIPVLLDAAAASTGSLRALVLRAAMLEGGAAPGIHVVIDGLDEMEPLRAEELLNNARTLALTWPDSRFYLTSRPLEWLAHSPDIVKLPLLQEEESARLAARVARVRSEALFAGASRDVRDAVRRPLFALLFGLHTRRRREHVAPPSQSEMLRNVIETAIGTRRQLSDAFMHLAERVLDRGGGPVPVREIEGSVAHALRGEQRLVLVSDDCFVFAVPLFAHWFGAEAIRLARIDLSKLLADPDRLERWRYALDLSVSGATSPEVDRIMAVIAHQDPGLGALVVDASIRKWGLNEGISAPPWREAGARIRQAMSDWVEGMGPLSGWIAPQRQDGSVATIMVSANGPWLNTSWVKGEAVKPDDDLEVIAMPPNAPPRSARPGADCGWAWRWALDDLRDQLTTRIKQRYLPLPSALVHETTWNLGRVLMGHGGFFCGPVDLPLIKDWLDKITDGWINVEQATVELEPIREWLRTSPLASGGTLPSPYVGPDNDDPADSWVWSRYSPNRLLLRSQEIYQTAFSAYEQLVSSHFTAFAPRLARAAMFPAVLCGRIRLANPRGTWADEPTITMWLEPSDGRNQVDIQLEGNDTLQEPDFEKRWRLVKSHRPRLQKWSYSRSILNEVFCAVPAATLAFSWLHGDLKDIGWVT